MTMLLTSISLIYSLELLCALYPHHKSLASGEKKVIEERMRWNSKNLVEALRKARHGIISQEFQLINLISDGFHVAGGDIKKTFQTHSSILIKKAH